ncbi:YetF domain-containing protein [Flavobacterium sp. DGU11]|uniref:YetF domain-containing protein n=1 Tax=Flavobacterium arundinis TaxID=3139143 RepID=A0ABU9I152_9FLAO
MKDIFEWKRLLFNDLPFQFVFEVAFRTVIMFTVVLLTLKFAGKRGVKQLSIFEVVIIISLGSAAGDPMFYEDVGLVPAIVVFLIILTMYRGVTWLLGKSKKFENFIEGTTQCLIEDGQFSLASFEREDLAQDEFFAELRLKSIEHLGQVRNAYIETNGAISVYFYDDADVKFGLPIRPQLFSLKSTNIPKSGIYACTFCANTQRLEPTTGKCSVCQREEWVEAIKSKRIV